MLQDLFNYIMRFGKTNGFPATNLGWDAQKGVQ